MQFTPHCILFRSTSHLNLHFPSAALTWNAAGVLLSLSLVTSTSMVVNDYFDARSGADAVNLEAGVTLLDKVMVCKGIVYDLRRISLYATPAAF